MIERKGLSNLLIDVSIKRVVCALLILSNSPNHPYPCPICFRPWLMNQWYLNYLILDHFHCGPTRVEDNTTQARNVRGGERAMQVNNCRKERCINAINVNIQSLEQGRAEGIVPHIPNKLYISMITI